MFLPAVLGLPAPQDTREIYRTSSPAVGAVEGGRMAGSCFAVANGQIALTSARVTGDEKTVTVRKGDLRIAAVVSYRDPQGQVAVLALTRPMGATLVLASDAPEIGAPLYLVLASGRGGQMVSTLLSGSAKEEERTTLQFDADAKDGALGSPIVDEAAHVIGMVMRTPEGTARGHEAVDTTALRSAIEGSGLYAAPTAPAPEPDEEDESEAVETEPSTLERFRSDMDFAKRFVYLDPNIPGAVSTAKDATLRFLTNSVYALHGYRFKDRSIAAMYASCAWYRPTSNSMSVVERRMSPAAKRVLVAIDRERKRRARRR